MNDHATHLALIFAADCDPDQIYKCFYTNGFNKLAMAIGEVAEVRRQLAESQRKDFYSCAFVEAAAVAFNKMADDADWHDQEEEPLKQMIDRLLAAGQAESDSLAQER